MIADMPWQVAALFGVMIGTSILGIVGEIVTRSDLKRIHALLDETEADPSRTDRDHRIARYAARSATERGHTLFMVLALPFAAVLTLIEVIMFLFERGSRPLDKHLDDTQQDISRRIADLQARIASSKLGFDVSDSPFWDSKTYKAIDQAAFNVTLKKDPFWSICLAIEIILISPLFAIISFFGGANALLAKLSERVSIAFVGRAMKVLLSAR